MNVNFAEIQMKSNSHTHLYTKKISQRRLRRFVMLDYTGIIIEIIICVVPFNAHQRERLQHMM